MASLSFSIRLAMSPHTGYFRHGGEVTVSMRSLQNKPSALALDCPAAQMHATWFWFTHHPDLSSPGLLPRLYLGFWREAWQKGKGYMLTVTQQVSSKHKGRIIFYPRDPSFRGQPNPESQRINTSGNLSLEELIRRNCCYVQG